MNASKPLGQTLFETSIMAFIGKNGKFINGFIRLAIDECKTAASRGEFDTLVEPQFAQSKENFHKELFLQNLHAYFESRGVRVTCEKRGNSFGYRFNWAVLNTDGDLINVFNKTPEGKISTSDSESGDCNDEDTVTRVIDRDLCACTERDFYKNVRAYKAFD
jgi:hypothetical protein